MDVDVLKDLLKMTGEVFLEVLIAIAPFAIVYLLAQFLFLKYRKSRILNLIRGSLISIIGLTVFLVGVKFGFMEVARKVGATLGSKKNLLLLIVLGLVIGITTSLADPSIYVLVHEVEEASGASIPKRLILIALSVGVGGAIALTMVRLYFNINILYFFVPGYIIAVLMSHFVDSDHAAMSFDSGGVVTGTMAASFILPFAIGVSEGLGNGNQSAGFGVVGFVALVPILTMLIIGIILRIERKRQSTSEEE